MTSRLVILLTPYTKLICITKLVLQLLVLSYTKVDVYKQSMQRKNVQSDALNKVCGEGRILCQSDPS